MQKEANPQGFETLLAMGKPSESAANAKRSVTPKDNGGTPPPTSAPLPVSNGVTA